MRVCIPAPEVKTESFIPVSASSAVYQQDKMWPLNSVITYGFVNGSEAQQGLFHSAIAIWQKHIDLSLVSSGLEHATIRVAFDAGQGSWSYIGTENKLVPKDRKTMNLGWDDIGTYLHEIGHMLGLHHEHKSPASEIKWNEKQVIAELSGPPNNWDEQTIRHNVLDPLDKTITNYSAFDPDSIMLYAFPKRWTLNGISTKANEALSAMDKKYISQVYPKLSKPTVEPNEPEKQDSSKPLKAIVFLAVGLLGILAIIKGCGT